MNRIVFVSLTFILQHVIIIIIISSSSRNSSGCSCICSDCVAPVEVDVIGLLAVVFIADVVIVVRIIEIIAFNEWCKWSMQISTRLFCKGFILDKWF